VWPYQGASLWDVKKKKQVSGGRPSMVFFGFKSEGLDCLRSRSRAFSISLLIHHALGKFRSTGKSPELRVQTPSNFREECTA